MSVGSRTAVVHIGLPKTGTTSLQRSLYDAREQLLTTGVKYLDGGRYPAPMAAIADVQRYDSLFWSRQTPGRRHHLRGLWRENPAGVLWRPLATRIQRCEQDRVILSSENLVYSGPQTLAALERTLAGWNVRVIITARRPSDLMPSMYMQSAKLDVMPSFDDWVRGVVVSMLARDQTAPMHWLDRNHLAADWRQVGHVEVLTTDVSGGLQRALAAMTGGDDVTLDSVQRANQRLPLAVILAAQAFLKERGPRHNYVLAPILAAAARRVPQEHAEHRLSIRAEAAQHIDGVFCEEVDGARDRLARMVESGECLVEDPSPLVPTDVLNDVAAFISTEYSRRLPVSVARRKAGALRRRVLAEVKS